MALARLLILVPLGVLAGACAAMFALVLLSGYVPELGVAFIGAIVSAWSALWSAAADVNHPDEIIRTFNRAGSLAMLLLLAPVAATAIIAEIARLRGALFHMLIAGVLTLILPFAAVSANRPPSEAEGRVLACLFFAGAAAGFVYWLIAGRRRSDNRPPGPSAA